MRKLFVSAGFVSATLTVKPPPPIKPNTRIKINGNTKLKITAEGLLKIALKLPLVIASIALTWLYCFIDEF
jgi:hypothetical protein